MKKVIVVFILSVLVFGLGKAAFAQLEEKKAELEKVKKYIVLLDNKIELARKAKQINKIAEINETKRNASQRAKKLSAEIATLEKVKPKARGLGPKGRGGLQASAGLGGGSLILGIGYERPLQQNMDIVLDAGYGFGNQFSVITAGVSGLMPFGDNYAGLRLGLANYSETVSGVLGVSGNVVKGSKFGLGVFAGRPIGPVTAQIGYDTALGLTAGAVYKF
ncbi:MAG: hypothetical protein ABIA67_03385 [Candidatus Margulisiibacteriota bacterium]